MGSINPYISEAAFLAVYPVANHSSRVFMAPRKTYPDPTGESIALSVADAFLRDVTGTIIDVSVSSGTIRDVSTSSSPEIGLNTTTLSFSSTVIGSTSDLTLTISNTGTADLVISSITPTGDFSVVSIS